MILYNTTNIKDLPSLEQILPGNYLIVENATGTNKLDFSDFVVGPSNTSFYTALANDILTVSANNVKTDSTILSLSSTALGMMAYLSPYNSMFYSSYLYVSPNSATASIDIATTIDLANLPVNKSHTNFAFDGFSGYSNGPTSAYPLSTFKYREYLNSYPLSTYPFSAYPYYDLSAFPLSSYLITNALLASPADPFSVYPVSGLDTMKYIWWMTNQASLSTISVYVSCAGTFIDKGRVFPFTITRMGNAIVPLPINL